ncbi:hypothetical protein DSUL_20544 [Desulfovibrionales bacterium]
MGPDLGNPDCTKHELGLLVQLDAVVF